MKNHVSLLILTRRYHDPFGCVPYGLLLALTTLRPILGEHDSMGWILIRRPTLDAHLVSANVARGEANDTKSWSQPLKN